MILLQANLFLGYLILPLPFVVFAHVCGLHFFLWKSLEHFQGFNLMQRIFLIIALLVVAFTAFHATIFWATTIGFLSLVIIAFPILGISLGFFLFIILLSLEALNFYHHFFSKKTTTFSIKNYSLSLLFSTGVFIGILLAIWIFLKNETFHGT